MIINRGKIVASDTPEHLSASLSHGHKMLVRVKGERQQALNAINEFPVIKHVTVDGSRETGTIDLVLSGEDEMDIREPIFRCMSKNNLPILSMKSMDLSLEEIFLQITGDTRTAAAGYAAQTAHDAEASEQYAEDETQEQEVDE
jgi:ABC-2 type transport system ATP-binding protein